MLCLSRKNVTETFGPDNLIRSLELSHLNKKKEMREDPNLIVGMRELLGRAGNIP